MKLTIPFHCKSDDRTRLSPYNMMCGDPMTWFDNALFRNEGINATTFDFFINWNDKTLQPIAWVKRTLTGNAVSTPKEIMDAIIKCDGNDKFLAVKNFCAANKIELSYILVPDIPCEEWSNAENKVMLFNVEKYENGSTDSVSQLSVKELINLIHTYRVKYDKAKMDKGGLIYSTTTLEYFLSRHHTDIGYEGDALYPGDADIVLFDDNYTPLAVIEIKKHNEGSKKYAETIEQESIDKYKQMDRLKYESLDILQKELDCKFYMLFFPTTNEKKIKMEKVKNLKVEEEKIFSLPNIHSPISMMEFNKDFLQWLHNSENTASNNLICPHCNGEVKHGKYGYYCSEKCGMDMTRLYGTVLTDEQVLELLQGHEVIYTNKNGIECIATPTVAEQTYNDQIYYKWTSKFNN